MSGQGRIARRKGATAVTLSAVAVGMVGLAFASKPLYNAFCAATGFGGTTQRAAAAPEAAGAGLPTVRVRFDANVNRDLPWRFKALQTEMKVKPGERTVAFYEATNTSDLPIVGTAVFNVSPYKMGSYFNKIECFCFTEQVLLPGQTMRMPVNFFVDPEMLDDGNTADVRTVTLSYTFYVSDDQSAAEELHVRAPKAADGNG